MNRMLVLGAYGCGNRGDDAILQSICELFPGWEIYATNGRFDSVSDFLPVKKVRCRLNEGFSFSVLGSMLIDSIRMLAIIPKCNMLVFGGGSLIHDLTLYNLPFMFFLQTWAKLFRKKVCYFSIGIGPLETSIGRKLCKFFLPHADALYVRDFRGLKLCKDLKIPHVQLTADAAFAVRSSNQCGGITLAKMQLTPKKYFCLSGSQWFKSDNFWNRNKVDFSKDIENLACAVRQIAQKISLPIVFVPTVRHDASLGENLRKLLNDIDFRIVPPEWNCKQMAEIVENSCFLLGIRMHSIIFAARQSVPFLALIYDEKVSQLLQNLELDELGIPLESLDSKIIQDKLGYISKNKEQIRLKLALKTDEFSQRILLSSQAIEEMVK